MTDPLYVEVAEPGAYARTHRQVHRDRGPASNHQCYVHGCERTARNWAWLRIGPWSTGDDYGTKVTWGLDPNTYAPMCVPHAARLDNGGTLTHCPAGHERTDDNTYVRPNGSEECRPCKREKRSARKALKIRTLCPYCGKTFIETYRAKHVRTMHAGEQEGQVDQ